MSGLRAERTTLVSFDGGVRDEVEFQRPDRYRMIEADLGTRPRIARGGGYSYAAASFGAGSLVVDMTRFNRVLRFNPPARLVEVEAGATLGDLLALTAPAGLWLPVQPGYPAITVGGCIAANVHGKNPAAAGTFARHVVDLTLFHPKHGTMRIDAATDPALFELTCGGYGLTGVIVAATLRLAPLPGTRLSMRRTLLPDLEAGLSVARAGAGVDAFRYTWQDAAPGTRPFGRGVAYEGTFLAGPPRREECARNYRLLTAASRARWPASVWNRATTGVMNWTYYAAERLRPEVTEISLFDSLFPFARRPEIFLLFGRPGFVEYQALVPDDQADRFLSRLRDLVTRRRVPSVLLSMKPFRGTQRLLRFERDGICVTIYLSRSSATVEFLPTLDELAVATGSIVNIIKDSRLPASVVRALYPDYEVFREALRSYDPQRLFRSELSERLDL